VENDPGDEGELVRRAQGGDERAFADLVRPQMEVSFRLAYVITRSAGDAEDAAQDAFVKAWRALGRFRAGEPFRPWLLRIVANEARNRRRSAGRRLGLVLRAARQPAAEAAREPADRQALLDALEALPEEARTVLVCRYLLGLSEAETATALGVAPGTVKSRVSRALDRLREIYA
jgi:RNA polymerase sigma factor (sigma-70 family)